MTLCFLKTEIDLAYHQIKEQLNNTSKTAVTTPFGLCI